MKKLMLLAGMSAALGVGSLLGGKRRPTERPKSKQQKQSRKQNRKKK